MPAIKPLKNSSNIPGGNTPNVPALMTEQSEASADRYEKVVADLTALNTLTAMFTGMRVWVANISSSGSGGVATWDGTMWDYDTKWITLAPASGITIPSGGLLQYRRIGKEVFVRGSATRTAGVFGNPGTTVATLPAGFRTSLELRNVTPLFPTTTATGTLLVVTRTNGEIAVAQSGSTSTDTVYFNYPFLVD